MKVRDTSLEAFGSIRHLNNKEKIVFETIQLIQPCTDRQISHKLGWEINRVTGRRNKLAEKGVIVEAGKARGDTGRMALTWKLKGMPGKQTQLNL